MLHKHHLAIVQSPCSFMRVSALHLLPWDFCFHSLHIESGAIRWEHAEFRALSNSFMGRTEVSWECCLWGEAGCDKELSPGFFSLRRDPTSGALLKKGPLELDIEEWVDVDRTSLAHVIKRNWSGTSPASKRAFRLASSCLHLLTSFGVSYKFTCHINSVVTRHGGACLQSQNSDGWGRRIEFEVWSCIAVWD